MLPPDELIARLTSISELWMASDEQRQAYINWLVETLADIQIYLDQFDRNA